MCENCKFGKKDEEFLRLRERNSVASGAIVIELNEEIEELKKRVEKTDKKLRFLL